MKKNSLLKIAIATFLLVGIGFIPHDSTASNSDAAPQHIAIDAAYGRLPLAFEANDGQVAPQVKFLSRGRGYSLFLTDTEAVLTLKKSRPVAADTEAGAAKRRARQRRTVETSVLRMTMLGANTEPKIAGADKLPGVVNYYRGTDPAKWRTGVATYEKVRLEKVYPGIDLVYYGNQRQLEYDYIVAPGANPKRIRLGFEGAQKISVDKGGDLVVETGGGEVRWHKPVVYQQVRGERKPVAGKYVLRNEKEISFQIARYDATKPLVIDPSLG